MDPQMGAHTEDEHTPGAEWLQPEKQSNLETWPWESFRGQSVEGLRAGGLDRALPPGRFPADSDSPVRSLPFP